jgi:hypothetical protein
MQSIDIEQRYWKHQFWHFLSTLLVLLSMLPILFVTAGAPKVPANPSGLASPPKFTT